MGKDPTKWLDNMQTQLMGTLAGQTGLLTSNFATLTTLVADQLTPALTGLMGVVNNILGGDPKKNGDRGLLGWLNQHPNETKGIAYGASGLALAALSAIAVNLVKSGSNFLAIIAKLGKDPGVYTRVGRVTTDIAGVAAKRGGLVGRLAGGGALLGMLGLPLLRSTFTQLGGIFRMFGMEALTTKGGLGLLGEVFAKLGLRAIPLLGEVLLLSDGLNFMFHHTKDIGKGLVIAMRWIMDTGGPLLANALIECIKGLLNAINPVNWINAGRGIFDGIREGINEAKAKQVTMGNAPVGLHLPKPHLGGGPIVQGSNLKVPTLNFPPPHAPGPRRERMREVALGTNPALHGPKLTTAVLPVAQMKATPPNAVLPSANPFTLSPNLTQPAPRTESPHRERTRAVYHPANVTPKLTLLTPRVTESHRELTREIVHHAPIVTRMNPVMPKAMVLPAPRTREAVHPAPIVTRMNPIMPKMPVSHPREITREVVHPANVSVRMNQIMPKALVSHHREITREIVHHAPIVTHMNPIMPKALVSHHRELTREIIHHAPIVTRRNPIMPKALVSHHRELTREIIHHAPIVTRMNPIMPKMPISHPREITREIVHPAPVSVRMNPVMPKTLILPAPRTREIVNPAPVVTRMNPIMPKTLVLPAPRTREAVHPTNVSVRMMAPANTQSKHINPVTPKLALPAHPAANRERPRPIASPILVVAGPSRQRTIEYRRERTREVTHQSAPVIQFHYHAPATGDQAAHERALLNNQRKLADTVSEAFANTLRTSGRAAGQSPAMAGASGFEFAGVPG